jgi:preprotein translocase subunit SecB
MINGKEVFAHFQFIGNRVNLFKFETKMVETKGKHIDIDFNYDYIVNECGEENGKHFGIIQFMICGKAKVGKNTLFKIDLVMEGAFMGELSTLSNEHFKEMLETNGLITLSQISRSFLISVSSQSGINPPVRLPMINILALREKKKSEIDKIPNE